MKPTSPPSDPRTTTAPATRNPAAPPSPRRLFAVAVAAVLLALGMTLSFGYADHDPRPHDVRVAVAAPPQVGARVAAGLRHADPGAFDVVRVPDAGTARRSVRAQSSAAAFVVPRGGPATILTAGAEGTLQQQVVTAAFTAVSHAIHRPLSHADVVPLSAGDRSGLSSFVFGLGLLIPSVIGSVGLFLLGLRQRLWWRVGAGIVFAVLAACAGVLALDTILGALTGSPAALIGIGVLGALSFVLFVAALQALVGLPGTALAAVAIVFVGNAISGGSVPVAFLPDGFRQIAPWLPNNAIIRGARDVIYFNGNDLGHPLLVLGLWPAVALGVLVAVDLLHLSERRRASEAVADVYRTPAVVHVRRRLRGSAAGGRRDVTPAR